MKDVIILAKGESRSLCPFDADEVWGVNDVGDLPDCKGKHIDMLFAFDPPELLPPGIIEGMKKVAPIMGRYPYADIQYPLAEIIERFNTSYFTNTICYMLAYAMFKDIPVLRLYGVDAAAYGGTYALEKSGIEYWLGRAQERGLAVQVSNGSHLLRTVNTKLYGERGEGTILLYLSERLNLLNLLPRKGRYKEITKASLARGVFAVKSHEGETHGVKAAKLADGTVSFTCPKEFTTSIRLPQEIWDYIADILRRVESKGELPVDALSLYEKLVLAGKADLSATN